MALSRTMKALVLTDHQARVSNQPEPKQRETDALVQMHVAGVCNTDLELVKGYMGFSGILGHELVGTVIDGPPGWLGKRVTSEINFACRACAMCEQGLSRHCPTRTVMGIAGANGALAERVVVPIANLHAIPDEVTDDDAAFIEPLAAAFEILEQAPEVATQRCLVFGDGKLGLLAAQVLHQAGANVLTIGKHAEKLAILASRGIQTMLLDTWLRKPVERFECVVEASGSSAGLALAVKHTRPRGTLVLKSTVAASSSFHCAPIVIDEIKIVGSRCGPFAPAIDALARKRIDVASMISARVPLDEAERALEVAAQRGILKVLVYNANPR